MPRFSSLRILSLFDWIQRLMIVDSDLSKTLAFEDQVIYIEVLECCDVCVYLPWRIALRTESEIYLQKQ
jgi:hypothetical protein